MIPFFLTGGWYVWYQSLVESRIYVIIMMSSNGNIFRLLVICAHNSFGEFTGDRWRGASMFSLICAWINMSKQPWGWWFETLPRSLSRHCNVRSSLHYCIQHGVILVHRLPRGCQLAPLFCMEHLFSFKVHYSYFASMWHFRWFQYLLGVARIKCNWHSTLWGFGLI